MLEEFLNNVSTISVWPQQTIKLKIGIEGLHHCQFPDYDIVLQVCNMLFTIGGEGYWVKGMRRDSSISYKCM